MKASLKGICLRRLSALCLSLVLVLALAVPALAEEAKATDLRLERTEGAVALQNANGKTVSAREGMKLYSGYTLSTQAASYAYITLDDEKAVKLDANSQVEIRKQGKKLEVLVKSGELFFNVKAPLAQDQSLNIRTSTMVTGIRGTSGYIWVMDDTRTAVTVLDGTVAVSTPDTGAYQSFETVNITAGQRGIVRDHEADEHWQVTFEGLKEEDLPGFVLAELAADAALVQRIAEDTQLTLEAPIANAQQRLEADQQADQEAQAAVEEAAAAMNTGSTSSAPPFQYEEPVVKPEEEPAGDGIAAPVPAEPAPTTPTTPSTPSTPTTPTTGSITLIKQLVDETGADMITDTEKSFTFTLSGPTSGSYTVAVPANASQGQLEATGLPFGTYTVTESDYTGTTITSGVVTYTYSSNSVSGTATLAADSLSQSVTVTNTYTKSDTVTITTAVDGATLQRYLDNYSTVNIGSGGSVGIVNGEDITVPSGNTLNVESGGSISIDSKSQLTNQGTMTNDGTIDNAYVLYNSGQFTNNNNGIITNTATETAWTFSNASTFDNYGTINNQGQVENYRIFNNAGTITNSGTFLNTTAGSASSTLNNSSKFNNTGTLTNMGGCTFNNNTGGIITNDQTMNIYGTLNNSAAITNSSGAQIVIHKNSATAQGVFTNLSGGELTNQGTVYIRADGSLSNSGTVTNNNKIYYNNGGEVTGKITGNQPEALP